MGYVATGGAIEKTVRDEIFKNMPLNWNWIDNTGAVEVTIYKNTFDFEDINKIVVCVQEANNTAGNNNITIDIGGVEKVNEDMANGTSLRTEIDTSAINGNQVFELFITTPDNSANGMAGVTINCCES